MLKNVLNNKGQTLVEAIIALTIIISIMTLTTVAVVSSLSNANFVKQQTQANKLAQEGMEYIRDRIANNNAFATFSSANNPYGRCMTSTFSISTWAPSTSVCPSTQQIDGRFSRVAKFVVAQCDSTVFANGLKATVSVHWTDGKCPSGSYCHKQEVTSCFINPSSVVTSPGL